MGRPRVYNRTRKIIGATISPAAYANYLKLPPGERSQRISRWLERIDPESDAWREPGERLGDTPLPPVKPKKPKPKVLDAGPPPKIEDPSPNESEQDRVPEVSIDEGETVPISTPVAEPTKPPVEEMGPSERAYLESIGELPPVEEDES